MGKELTEPSEALAVTLGMRRGWHVFRSQEFCPEVLAIVTFNLITACVPTSFIGLFPNSLLSPGPCHCGLWPGSHNVKVLDGTLKPQKKGSSPVEGREGTPDFEGICRWHQGLPWQEAAPSGHPGHLSYTFSEAPFSQTTKGTYPQYTKYLTSLGLACPRLTGLPISQRDPTLHPQAFPNFL